MSDVVATILLLAISVSLFASILVIVNQFPRPPSQPSGAFQASLAYSARGGGAISAVSITRLTGAPLASDQVQIYLHSDHQPSAFPTPFSVSAGLPGSATWGLGQTWTLNVSAYALFAPDNLSVSIVRSNELLFQATLPATTSSVPPEFLHLGISPAEPTVGEAITITTQLSGPGLNLHSVYVNISALPGVTGPLRDASPMTYSPTTGVFAFTVPAGVTTSTGTFNVFLNASNQAGTPNSIALSVTISGGAGSTPVAVTLVPQPAAPVVGQPARLTALVTNPSATGGTVSVSFTADGTSVGSAGGSIGGGIEASFSSAWTPTSSGTVVLTAVANISGVGGGTAILSLTVYPSIFLVATNEVAGSEPAANDSAYLAEQLVAAGIPFFEQFVPCGAALPTNLSSWDVAILDFGSANSGTCASAPSRAVQGQITSAAATTSLWVVGSSAFGATSCRSYQASYFSLFGLGYRFRATCTAVDSSSQRGATWTASATMGLRSDGIGSISLNQTFAHSNAHRTADSFSRGVNGGGTAFLTTSAGPVGVFRTSGSLRFVALAASPVRLSDALPNGQTWVSGGPGVSAVYNVMDYLCGFASSSSPGRALPDAGVAGVKVWGTDHATTTTVYAAIRENGPSGGSVTVRLLVNGSMAYYEGVPVTETVTIGGDGAWSFVPLLWQAPGAGAYTIAVSIVSSSPGLYGLDNQLVAGLSNQPITFA